MNNAKQVLVLGASGGIGGELTRALLSSGWQVRAMRRGAAATEHGMEWVSGDAMRREDVLKAARGVAVIVHAVNPPGYKNWEQTVLPMLANSIAAARENGALVVLPGTVYNFGPETFPEPKEDAVQHP